MKFKCPNDYTSILSSTLGLKSEIMKGIKRHLNPYLEYGSNIFIIKIMWCFYNKQGRQLANVQVGQLGLSFIGPFLVCQKPTDPLHSFFSQTENIEIDEFDSYSSVFSNLGMSLILSAFFVISRLLLYFCTVKSIPHWKLHIAP